MEKEAFEEAEKKRRAEEEEVLALNLYYKLLYRVWIHVLVLYIIPFYIPVSPLLSEIGK
jgi:hypothetical protein